MKQHFFIRLAIILAALLATAPASAQLFKWVDERGVTNYSDQPPADPAATKKIALVVDKISVYTPDKALIDAVAVFQRQSNNRLAERVGNLERELEYERQARQYASAAPADTCMENWDINCNGVYNGYFPYYRAVAVIPFRNRPRNIGALPSRHFRTASMSRGFGTR